MQRTSFLPTANFEVLVRLISNQHDIFAVHTFNAASYQHGGHTAAIEPSSKRQRLQPVNVAYAQRPELKLCTAPFRLAHGRALTAIVLAYQSQHWLSAVVSTDLPQRRTVQQCISMRCWQCQS